MWHVQGGVEVCKLAFLHLRTSLNEVSEDSIGRSQGSSRHKSKSEVCSDKLHFIRAESSIRWVVITCEPALEVKGLCKERSEPKDGGKLFMLWWGGQVIASSRPRSTQQAPKGVHSLGPRKLLLFDVHKNPKIYPQIHMVGGLKSTHLDKGHHVSSKKEISDFFCSIPFILFTTVPFHSIWMRVWHVTLCMKFWF